MTESDNDKLGQLESLVKMDSRHSLDKKDDDSDPHETEHAALASVIPIQSGVTFESRSISSV